MALGSYAIERDYSHYVSHTAKTVLAVVGTATKGPVNVPTVCTSAQDLVNKFGPLTPDCMALYAGQYFLSQSSKLYFVRAASNYVAATRASATIKDAIATGAEGKFVDLELIWSKSGSLGNEVSYSIIITSSEQAIHVMDSTGKAVETISLEELNDILTNHKYKSAEGVSTYDTNYITLSFKSPEYPEVYTSNISSGATEVKFSGGTDESYSADTETGDYITALNTLSLDSIDMNLLAIPGVSEAAVITAALSLAESRGDCLAIIDPPQGLTREGVVDWVEGTGDWKQDGGEGHAAFNSSYGAVYYDWGVIYDSINKLRIAVPPSVYVPASIAYNDRISEIWYAPAGLNRGLIRGVLEAQTKLNKAEIEELYSHNINSIYEDPQAGLVIWGQKTLLKSDTALNRVNTRRLLAYLKRIIVAACDALVFEPNDRITWNSFEMKVQPVLESVKNRRGVYEYQIIRGETIVSDTDVDNYRMPCMVLIRPTKAAEEIPIYFTITSTGADFNEVLDANGITIE